MSEVSVTPETEDEVRFDDLCLCGGEYVDHCPDCMTADCDCEQFVLDPKAPRGKD